MTGGRAIGGWGTTARAGAGTAMVASVLYGHATRGWDPLAWLLGLLVAPSVVTAWRWFSARRTGAALRSTGPLGHALNLALFPALYLTWWYAPGLDVLSDAALVFYGASMLVSAVRGSAGCEVLAVSNLLLRRDDRIGCAVFWPFDTLDSALATRRIARRRGVPLVELFVAAACPNAAAARAAVAEGVQRCGQPVLVHVQDHVGDYPSPTVLVAGVDVMTGRRGAPQLRACRLDVPTVADVLAALRAGSGTPSREETTTS